MVFGRCTHLCCIPGWQLVSNTFTEDTWTPGGGDDGGTKLFCICHSSRFDPTALELNTNRNRANGATFTYAGIRRSEDRHRWACRSSPSNSTVTPSRASPTTWAG